MFQQVSGIRLVMPDALNLFSFNRHREKAGVSAHHREIPSGARAELSRTHRICDEHRILVLKYPAAVMDRR